MKIKITFSVNQLRKILELLKEYKEFNSNDLVRFYLSGEIWEKLAKSLSDAMIEKKTEVKTSLKLHEACLLAEFSSTVETELTLATMLKNNNDDVKIKVL
jgi:hypothetical protein